jgi:hypothetical protein
VCHEPQEITELSNIQLAILVPVSHLKFSLDKAQQLRLADFAIVVAAVRRPGVFSHRERPHGLIASDKMIVLQPD